MAKVKSTPGSIAFVIFGVTGDLTKRKLLPALYQLESENRLPEKIDIIGFARRPWDDAFLKRVMSNGIKEYARISPPNNQTILKLLLNAKYIQSEFEDRKGYEELIQYLQEKNLSALPPDN